MIIVSDTSPVSNLLIVDRLYLLESLFGRIIIPKAVYAELVRLEDFGISIQAIREATWIEILSPSNHQLVEKLSQTLDAGESAAIALALELHAELILMDESEGRAFARSYGLNPTGVVGLLIRAKAQGLISHVKPELDMLIRQANFWISAPFYKQVLHLVGEDES